MWFEKAKQSYEPLSADKIVIVGFSMGGIIAGLLAKYPPDKLVLIAPLMNVNIKYLVNPYRFINNMRYADVKILEMILLEQLELILNPFYRLNYNKSLYIPEQIVSLIIHGTIDGLVPIENLN